MPKIERQKIDCLHRPCSRPAPRGKIKSVRTHSEVSEQFDSFSLLKLLFLVRNWHCWSRKAFTRQMTPQIREKTAKTAVFHSADRHEKLYGRSRLYASAQGRHETGSVLSLFSSLSFDISIKNSMQRWSSDFQGLFCVKIRKMAQGSNDLSTLPLIFVCILLCTSPYFLFLSLSVIARCFVSFILVQFFFTSVFMLQFCLQKKKKKKISIRDRNMQQRDQAERGVGEWACCTPKP